MDTILYLDDYINLYIKKENKIIKCSPYKNTLLYGHIIDRNKFIKRYNKLIEENKLTNNLFNNNITIIINNTYTEEDKRILLEVFEELNYKNIKFIQEINYLNIEKKNVYICFNYNYFYIYDLSPLGKVKVYIFLNNNLTKYLIPTILKYFKNKKIFIYGKNYQEIVNILKNTKYHYYYFEESENLILKIFLSKKFVK